MEDFLKTELELRSLEIGLDKYKPISRHYRIRREPDHIYDDCTCLSFSLADDEYLRGDIFETFDSDDIDEIEAPRKRTSWNYVCIDVIIFNKDYYDLKFPTLQKALDFIIEKASR